MSSASLTLTCTLIQPDIIWEDKQANLVRYEQLIRGLPAGQVVVLPEMFSTGFSMQPAQLAENMDGVSVTWMREMALRQRCILTGSLMIAEEGRYYNRMIWMQPDGQYFFYDKRHLFAFAGEHAHYSRGERRLIVRVNGWRICLAVCYDLRFPVWLRNRGDEYDVLIIVANWPARRRLAWKTLLQARAIENQCYTIGVNRIGEDGHGINHAGDSSIFDPIGTLIWQQADTAAVHTVVLQKETLEQVRTNLPFLQDADDFLFVDTAR